MIQGGKKDRTLPFEDHTDTVWRNKPALHVPSDGDGGHLRSATFVFLTLRL